MKSYEDIHTRQSFDLEALSSPPLYVLFQDLIPPVALLNLSAVDAVKPARYRSIVENKKGLKYLFLAPQSRLVFKPRNRYLKPLIHDCGTDAATITQL